jgi:hypothetical protein
VSASLPKTPGQGGPAWYEITTQHFVILTNMDDAEAVKLANELENTRAVITKVVYGREPPVQPKAWVLALRRDEYAEYFDARAAIGVFFPSTWFEPVMITSTGSAGHNYAVRTHELAHYMSSLYVPSRFQHRWYAEGVASYLETISHNLKTGEVRVGRPPGGARWADPRSLASYDQLWQFSNASGNVLYATSWVAVHYLMHRRAADFDKYQQALADGADAKAAWEQIFPDLRGSEFDKAIQDYMFRFTFEELKGNVPAVIASIERRVLGDADVLALRSSLYWLASERNLRPELERKPILRSPEQNRKLAKENLKQAMGLDSSSFWAHLANWHFEKSLPKSRELARTIISRYESHWLAWLWYAEVLRAEGASVEERREALANAERLAPNEARVKQALSDLEGEPATVVSDEDSGIELAADPEQAIADGTSGMLLGRVCFVSESTNSLRTLPECTPEAILRATAINIPPRPSSYGFPGIDGRNDWFSVDFQGSFSVARPGTYAFRVLADDGAMLFVNDKLVVDNDGLHAPESKSGSIELVSGTHRLRLVYLQGPPSHLALQLFVTPPGKPEQLWKPVL